MVPAPSRRTIVAALGSLALPSASRAAASARGVPAGVPTGTPDPAPGPADQWLGAAGARVEVVEYGSLDCPHCADFMAAALPAIRRAYVDPGVARYSFRDMPLHSPAVTAAAALRAAGTGAERVALATFLLANRKAWEAAPDPESVLASYLVTAGATRPRADALLTDPAVRASVIATWHRGYDLGVRFTPTFFVNGRMLPGSPDAQALGQAIVDAARG